MLNLIHGEIYRLLHKKSLYIYFGILLAGYFLITFVRSGGFDAGSVLDDSTTYFNFFPALAGGFLFAAIYTDDLNAKNLITLVGYGLNKTKIVFAKLILGVAFSALFFGLLPLVHCGFYALLGHEATASQMTNVYIVSFKYFLLTVAFFAISSIVVYGLQRTTFAIVTYILLAFNVIGSLVLMVVNVLKLNIAEYLLSNLTDKILLSLAAGDSIVMPLLGCLVYVAVAVTLSAIVFHKKEMEF